MMHSTWTRTVTQTSSQRPRHQEPPQPANQQLVSKLQTDAAFDDDVEFVCILFSCKFLVSQIDSAKFQAKQDGEKELDELVCSR